MATNTPMSNLNFDKKLKHIISAVWYDNITEESPGTFQTMDSAFHQIKQLISENQECPNKKCGFCNPHEAILY